jgi:hypothetical protein
MCFHHLHLYLYLHLHLHLHFLFVCFVPVTVQPIVVVFSFALGSFFLSWVILSLWRHELNS